MRQNKATTKGTGVLQYLQWLINQDRKLTPLKELQGLIWEKGYSSGKLQGPLFDDVAACLKRWYANEIRLAVYSSGSVGAQQLIYGYSNGGDLRPLFEHWFYTRVGPKCDDISYTKIAKALGVPCSNVLFVSDALAECQAAGTSGMQVLFSDRPGNPEHGYGGFERIISFEDLELNP